MKATKHALRDTGNVKCLVKRAHFLFPIIRWVCFGRDKSNLADSPRVLLVKSLEASTSLRDVVFSELGSALDAYGRRFFGTQQLLQGR
jgi:hypothetical protein